MLTVKSRTLISLVIGTRELGILKGQTYGKVSLVGITRNGFSRGHRGSFSRRREIRYWKGKTRAIHQKICAEPRLGTMGLPQSSFDKDSESTPCPPKAGNYF